MAQGTRVRWMRAAVAGFGMLASTGLVGCMNGDKSKETKGAPPKAGLPGTPTLPPGGGAAQAKWQPGPGQYAGPGNNLQQTGGFAAGAPRTGTNNLNTTAGAGQQYGNWPPAAGSPGTIGSPAQTGVTPSVQPAANWNAGPVGAAPVQPAGGAVAGYGPTSPPPPDLLGGPLPPPAPPHPSGAELTATGGVLPPVPGGPLAPIAPPAPPTVNHSVGVFGGK